MPETRSPRPGLLRALLRERSARAPEARPFARPYPCFETLEPRLLLTGELGLGLDLPRDANEHERPGGLERGAALEALLNAPPIHASAEPLALPPALDLDALGGLGAPDAVAAPRSELVVLDAAVEGYEQLLADLRGRSDEGVELEVRVLEAGDDGIEALSDLLAGYSDLDAVHVVSHGSPDGFQLGAASLDLAAANARAERIAGWSETLAGDADLLLYGCNLAASPDGLALVERLASLTGADVAASEDLTGSAALGGDWALEYTVGRVDASAVSATLAAADWSGVLGSITVSTTFDVLDADADTSSLAALAATPGSDGLVSLREAIIAANTDIGADTILLGADDYTLSITGGGDAAGDLDIKDTLTLSGVSPADTRILGDGSDRILHVHDDAAITVSLSDMKLEGGRTSGGNDGAALFIQQTPFTPTVNVDNVWFYDNQASGLGGAISNEGNLTITNSLVENNSAGDGGGVFVQAGGTLSMTNVTLTGNAANAGGGGGLYNDGTVTLRNVTVTNNSASEPGPGTGQGGGIQNFGGTVDIGNSIVAGNSAEGSSDDVRGDFTSSGSNIIQVVDTATGFAGGETGIDPQLGSFGDHGGNFKTWDLQATSPAIGGADAASASFIDQRGFLRDDGAPDIGAHEVNASATPVDLTLHIATKNDVSNGGQPGVEDWSQGDLVAVGDPELNLGPVTTSGTFSIGIDVDAFAPGIDLGAAHLVTRNIAIGSSNFQLLAGDVLLTAKSSSTTFASNNLTPRDPGFAASVVATKEDLVVFRPDTAGDYSTGAFAFLLDDVSGTGDSLRSITLIEQTTVVGGTTLEAGDFLFSRGGSNEDHDIWLYETKDIGAGGSPDDRRVLLAGEDGQVGIHEKIRGLELLEEAATIGGQTLAAGTLLVTVDTAESVGANGIDVDEFDVFTLDVSKSTLAGGAGNGIAQATMLFDGSHVGFDDINDEVLDALMLAPTGGVVTGHYLDRFDTTASYLGDDGTLSWSGGWTEVGESDGAGLGDIKVANGFAGGGTFELEVNSDKGAYREADLSGAASATLSFEYARTNFGATDHLVVYAQAGGAGSVSVSGAPGMWDEIARYSGPADDGSYLADSIDISAYIASDTRIMFCEDGASPDTQRTYIDNVRIDLAGIATENGAPTITGLDTDNVTFTEDMSGPVLLDEGSDAVVGDVDSADFDGGVLTAQITAGADASEDVLQFNTGGTVSLSGTTSGSNVLVGATVVGTLGSDITEGNTLTVNLNADAKETNVQTLVRALEYDNTDVDDPTSGARTVRVTVSDGDGGTSANNDVTVTVNKSNDAPTLSGGPYGLTGTDEDTTSTGVQVSTIVGGLTTNDADGDTLGVAVTTAAGNGSWQYSTDSTDGTDGAWTSFGAVAGNNALLLANTSWVRYAPDGVSGETASLTFHTWDGSTGTASTTGSPATADPAGGGGSSAYSSTTAQADLVVTGVNDSPSLGDATLAAVDEDTTSPPGETIATLFGGTFSDVDGTFAGLAIVGNSANAGTEGVWQYSSDAGANWADVGTVADDATALPVDAATRLRFVPVADYNGAPPDLVVRAIDDTFAGAFSTTTGGTETRETVDASTNGDPTPIAATTSTVSTTIVSKPEIVTLTAIADTWIDEASTGANYGSDTTLVMGSDPAVGPPGGDHRILVRFDLSGLPSLFFNPCPDPLANEKGNFFDGVFRLF